METKTLIVETLVQAPVEKVWECWTAPEHITNWNFASEDWHSPSAENDLRVGGKFKSRMEAKDGSFGFDFEGQYDAVTPLEEIAYTMPDGRKVSIRFQKDGSSTKVTETFEPESQHPLDFQKAGWQAILDNFKKYTEAKA